MNIFIVIILILTSISTATLGVFLVIRKMSMLIDSISHTVLLGIVLSFMIVNDLSSPLLYIGATIMGVITAFLTQSLIKTKKTSEDSATGLIFPLLFSIAILIIYTQFSNVHLDTDAVLLGKIEFSIFDPIIINNVSIGPRLLYVMLVVTIINIVFIKVFFKELKIVSFDSALAQSLGFLPFIIHYLLMFLVSLTAVSSFNAVGTILVVALMIGPAASAVVITKDLKITLLIACIIGIINSILGYILALIINVNISGAIATITLITFLIILILEPKKGIITSTIKRLKLKNDYAFLILIIHLNNHKNNANEISLDTVGYHLNWNVKKLNRFIKQGINHGLITIDNNLLHLSNKGLDYHNKAIKSYTN